MAVTCARSVQLSLKAVTCARNVQVIVDAGKLFVPRAGYRFIGQTPCKTEKTGRISGSYPVTHPVLILGSILNVGVC